MGINFLMVVDPAAIAGAPHTHIATVYADHAAEAPLLRDVAGTWPNITAVPGARGDRPLRRVARRDLGRDPLGRGGDAADRLRRADRRGGGGRAAPGVRGGGAQDPRRHPRRASCGSFALRAALIGLAAGLVAILAGAAGGWAVTAS